MKRTFDFFKFNPKDESDEEKLSKRGGIRVEEEVENLLCGLDRIWYFEDEIFTFGLKNQNSEKKIKENKDIFERFFIEIEDTFQYCNRFKTKKKKCMEALCEGCEFK